jgi:hypothetical protein
MKENVASSLEHNSSEKKPRFTSTLVFAFAVVAFSTFGLMSYVRRLSLRETTVTPLAPGLTLTKTLVQSPNARIPEYIVRAERKYGWQSKLVPADYSVTKRLSVSEIAANYQKTSGKPAPVAINGGFFAYDGAAVGAVKIEGEWQRLPWKNRTAIGWDKNGEIKIDNLQAVAQVTFDNADVPVTNLNGAPNTSSTALITDRFAPDYLLKTGEFAVALRNSKIISLHNTGKILLPRGLQLLVAGAASPENAVLRKQRIGNSARFEVKTTPEEWRNYPTILGAGPRLIKNGVIDVTHVEEEFKPDVIALGPRTTVGVDKEGNLIILVIEAWHDKIRGMNLEATAAELQRIGVVDAINLDGGSSTTLVINGKSITHASDLVVDSKIVEPASDRREIGVANAVVLTKSQTKTP